MWHVDQRCSLCREEHGDNASHLKCRVGKLQGVEHFPSLGCFLLDTLWDVIDSTLLIQISIKKHKNPVWIPWEHLLSWLIITYCETFPKKGHFTVWVRNMPGGMNKRCQNTSLHNGPNWGVCLSTSGVFQQQTSSFKPAQVTKIKIK